METANMSFDSASSHLLAPGIKHIIIGPNYYGPVETFFKIRADCTDGSIIAFHPLSNNKIRVDLLTSNPPYTTVNSTPEEAAHLLVKLSKGNPTYGR